MAEDEMVGWHHQLNGHEFEKALGESEGQGSLGCCRPWSHKESDMTERLNNNKTQIKRKKKRKLSAEEFMLLNCGVEDS